MKKDRKGRVPSSDPIANVAAAVAAVAERTEMNGKLLQELALALAADGKAQRRFRTAVLIRLSRIETLVQMIHGAQIVEAHMNKPGWEEKMEGHVKEAEELLARKSEELGRAMVKFIHEESEPAAPDAKRKRRRERSC